MPEPIAYLDNAATTRMHPEVAAAMAAVSAYANPSSNHTPGRAARAVLEGARARLARYLEVAPEELVFTAGATEANNLAVLGSVRAARVERPHVVTTAIEHAAVLGPVRALEAAGASVTIVAPAPDGRVRAEAVAAAVNERTVLVSVMLANNETGAIQPVREIVERLQGHRPLVHTDAAQACGKLAVRPADLGVDLLTLSAHKAHGPRASGALWIRRGVRLEPLTYGGGHEAGLRPGTEHLEAAVGLAAAVAIAVDDLERNVARMRGCTDRLRTALSAAVPGLHWHAEAAERLPNILSVAVPGVDAEALLMQLDGAGVYCSTGSACTAGSLEPSHVLEAMGIAADVIRATVRLSVAADTTDAEIAHALAVLPPVVERLRALA